MNLGTIVVATDLNPLYCEFIPSFVNAWRTLVPEADICIVMIADAIPEKYLPYAREIHLFEPIPGMHTAFQAQCVRLLFPRHLTRDEGVLITDMDILPMRRSFYVDPIADVPADHFVVYRDVCLPNAISICYNIAHPSIWSSIFGPEATREILVRWYAESGYHGTHGGRGWGTDQAMLFSRFREWRGKKVVMNDLQTGFARLDRATLSHSSNDAGLRRAVRSGCYSDYHCLRPYSEHKDINDFIVGSLPR